MEKNKTNHNVLESGLWYENRLKHYYAEVSRQNRTSRIAESCSDELETFLGELASLTPHVEEEERKAS